MVGQEADGKLRQVLPRLAPAVMLFRSLAVFLIYLLVFFGVCVMGERFIVA